MTCFLEGKTIEETYGANVANVSYLTTTSLSFRMSKLDNRRATTTLNYKLNPTQRKQQNIAYYNQRRWHTLLRKQ